MNKLTALGVDKSQKDDNYTVFLNHDKELKDKIINWPDVDSFNDGWDQTWKIEKNEGKDVKCSSGRDVKYFTKKEVEKYKSIERAQRINQELYPIVNFWKQHGKLFLVYDSNDHLSVKMCLGGQEPCKNAGGLSDMGGMRIAEFSLYPYGEGLNFRVRECSQICFLHFTADGNFTNRDYNVKLQDYSQEPFNLIEFYERIKKFILKMGEVKTAASGKADKFFTYKNCFTIQAYYGGTYDFNFQIHATPVQVDKPGTYKEFRQSAIKLPAQTKTLSAEQLWEIIEKRFLSEVKEFLTKEYIVRSELPYDINKEN